MTAQSPAAHRRDRPDAARDPRRRHHHARRRRDRQRGQPLAARRRRRRRRHPSRGRAGTAGGMPHARRLRRPAAAKITRGYRLQGAPRHPRGRAGVAAAAARTRKTLLAGCYRSALDLAAAHRADLDRLSGDLHRRLSLSRRSRRAHRGRHRGVGTLGQPARHRRASIFCCFSADSAEHHTTAFAELGLV